MDLLNVFVEKMINVINVVEKIINLNAVAVEKIINLNAVVVALFLSFLKI